MDIVAAGGMIKLVQAGGVVAVLCMINVFLISLWKAERNERQKLQEQLLLRSAEHVRTIVQSEIAMRQLRDLLTQKGVIVEWIDPPNTSETLTHR